MTQLFVEILPLVCAVAFTQVVSDSWISRIDMQAITSPSTVHAREMTGYLEAASADRLRERITEFVSSNPDRYSFVDPQTEARVDSLKHIQFSRSGRGSLRADTFFVHVFTSSGEPRRKVVIWTDSERLVMTSQVSEFVDRNNIARSKASEYSSQLDSGIMPWDLARVDDGGYFECVSIATSLLEQAADAVVTDLPEGAIRVESKTLGVMIEILSQDRVSLAVFQMPGRKQVSINKFYWDRDFSASPSVPHPSYWISYRTDYVGKLTELSVLPSQQRRTIRFDKVEVSTSPDELTVSFDWRDLSDRLRDKRSRTVYDHNNDVDVLATERVSQDAQSEPVRFFDVVETDKGPMVRARAPSGLSQRYAVIAFGSALFVVGAVIVFRGRVKW